ncbi:MAG: 3-deoxy-manno-octulosonate cytidylyltransferase [Thiotrichaceae bacterium]
MSYAILGHYSRPLASTRFPGKLLYDLAGQPIIQHVYRHACESGATQVIVATDDSRIAEVAQAFGATVCMTAVTHQSGTDRVAEAARHHGATPNTIIVNVQGDEPLLHPTLIHQVAEALNKNPHADIATLCEPIATTADILNPNIVKVVRDHAGCALYFSRAPIPYIRDGFEAPHAVQHARHLGIYAYHAEYLWYYTQLKPCALEQAEMLEQLRVLATGGKIYVEMATVASGIGIDTAEDLDKVRHLFAQPDNLQLSVQ